MCWLNTVFTILVVLTTFNSHAQGPKAAPSQRAPVAAKEPAAAKKVVTLNILDWGSYYLLPVQESLTNTLSNRGLAVKFQYVTPILTTADALFTTLSKGGSADILTPSMNMFGERPDLKFRLYPIPMNSVPRLANIPATILEAVPRSDSANLSCVPTFGGYMKLFYKKDIDASAPKNFTVFTDPRFKGAYAIPSYSPWYLGYLTYEILNTPLAERFTLASLRSPRFRQQFKTLIANAGLNYDNYTLEDPKFEKMKVLLAWGFRISKTWVRPNLSVPLPFYMDCLSITPKAAADKDKLFAFQTIADWFLRPENQNRMVSNVEAFNMYHQKLDKKEFFKGLRSEEMAELKALHAEALVGAKK